MITNEEMKQKQPPFTEPLCAYFTRYLTQVSQESCKGRITCSHFRDVESTVRLEEFNYCIHGSTSRKKHTWDLKAGVTDSARLSGREGRKWQAREEGRERGRQGGKKEKGEEGRSGSGKMPTITLTELQGHLCDIF